jgi:hypothetical protein
MSNERSHRSEHKYVLFIKFAWFNQKLERKDYFGFLTFSAILTQKTNFVGINLRGKNDPQNETFPMTPYLNSYEFEKIDPFPIESGAL